MPGCRRQWWRFGAGLFFSAEREMLVLHLLLPVAWTKSTHLLQFGYLRRFGRRGRWQFGGKCRGLVLSASADGHREYGRSAQKENCTVGERVPVHCLWRCSVADGSRVCWGGCCCFCGDLARFSEALNNGELVTPHTFETMKRERATSGDTTLDGLGLELVETPLGTLLGHNGGFPGSSSAMYSLLNQPTTIIGLENELVVSDDLLIEAFVALMSPRSAKN